MDIKVVTKSWGSENTWSFGTCSNSQRYSNNREYTEKCCLYPGEHTLICKDSYGDGWHGGYVEIQGNRYCQEFETGDKHTTAVTIAGTNTNDFLQIISLYC